ncbi:hypothetical protein BJ138DRAFT_1143944 [Hygrophoropsis aurantiaca]|uniref:Uncharacterized protein n=1 Tax=Hygrophoropsis aurantiaca TaxID=72124 RepID=A0ACB8ALR3_9AGAM|nr:hypothetical protein BJ138DRAFT_1143944 [Hygrophoropsis aurantiaca]
MISMETYPATVCPSISHVLSPPRSSLHFTSPPSSSSLERRCPRAPDLPADHSFPTATTLTSSDDGNSLRAAPSSSMTRSARRAPTSARVFAPLTPILASPLTTPATSLSPNTFCLSADTEDEKNRGRVGHATVDLDYLDRGGFTGITRRAMSPGPTLTPTWTSTPPTPPPKYAHRTSNSLSSKPISAPAVTSTSFPDSVLTNKSSEPCPRRRASLPPMSLSKTLPETPPPPPSSIFKNVPPSPASKSTPRSNGNSPRTFVLDQDADHAREQSNDKLALPGVLQTKPLFHFVPDTSDKEDYSPIAEEATPRNDLEDSADLSMIVDDLGLLSRDRSSENRDKVRKYHALMELLSTEMGYLLDLKILVSVYLRLLPILTCRPATSPSHFSSASNLSFSRSQSSSTMAAPLNENVRASSYSYLPGLNSPVPTKIFSESQSISFHQPNNTYVPRERNKYVSRHLFSSAGLDLITRNAEELLKIHEHFVQELQAAIAPFGFFMALESSHGDIDSARQRRQGIGTSSDNLQGALYAVASLFVERASGFNEYQAFCSGHPEAFDLVRKVQQEHPVEWEHFERRCASMASDMCSNASEHLSSMAGVTEDDQNGAGGQAGSKKRRHSLSSLEAAPRPQTLAQVRSNSNLKVPLSASEIGHSDRAKRDRAHRLVFMDYLIKPVQRICKYPLLLDQLQIASSGSKSASGSSRDSSVLSSRACLTSPESETDAVHEALIAMRTVANSVDEARRRQDLAMKSSLIVSRITQAVVSATSSYTRIQSLTTAFLSSLGPCHLAGSLDVVHYHANYSGSGGTVKAKYLGAFLYPGGYIVLVKVTKGKVYEPKHWFSLTGFDLVDAKTDDALLPSWFRLSCKGHVFELAASCRREKDIWMDGIHHTLQTVPYWTEEPLSSLQAEGKADMISSMLEDTPYEAISPLPTIQSIPELDMDSFSDFNENPPAFARRAEPRTARSLSKGEYLGRYDPAPTIGGPSRRSSSASSKGFLSPLSESDTIHLVRSTAPAREQVDRGLLDVFSENCLSARFHANTHEEELFHAQKVSRSFSRSSSGLTMAGAMSVAAKNRLTKRESVLVPRRKSFADGYGLPSDSAEACVTTFCPPLSKVPGKRKHPKKLRIIAVPRSASSDGEEDRTEILPDSPTPISQCSSVSASLPASLALSPISGSAPFSAPAIITNGHITQRPEFLAVRRDDFMPKRSRSMVDGVRGFFNSRTPSPTLATSQGPLESGGVNLTPSRSKWWSKESLRRRVRSAPDVPAEELPANLTSKSLNGLMSLPRPSLGSSERPVSQPDLKRLGTFPQSAGPSSTFGLELPTPTRKKSIFSAHSIRRRSTASATISTSRMGEQTTSPRSMRMHRNLSFLQRFSPLSPSTVSQTSG